MSGTDADQRLIKARTLYENDDLIAALELLHDLGDRRERIVEGHLWALRVLCRRDLYELALEEQGDDEEEAEEEPDWTAPLIEPGASREFLLAAGIFFTEETAYELAETVLEHLCSIDDADTRHVPILNLARVHELDGRVEEAVAGYRRVIALSPEWPHGHLYLARCLRDNRDPDDAIPSLSRYLELEPQDIDEWIALAIIHSNASRYKSAELAYKRAAKIDPTNMSLSFNRGITARRAEDQRQLEACVSTLEAEDPEDWRTHLLRGYLCELQGKIWEAWEAFNDAANQDLLRSDDEEARECAAAHALAFVVEHEMTEQALQMASRCYDTFVFSYDVLYQLRRLGNQHAIEAFDYGVLIKSDLTDRKAIEQLRQQDENGPPYCFFRSYRIIADKPEVAAQIALEFEERVGGANIEVEEITEVERVNDVFLGVWWLARELHCFSKNESDDE